ncbi:MAG TPA: metalloregulator ArsR/SmtB family transcription factor [Kofleriaceae bacterium]|nr:metalloregulator ArsR/SmtB family transcription factor [Kofleriaceae bacterium]
MPRRALAPESPDPDIARLAGVLADATRVAMLDVLLDGDAHPIGTLARRAGVSAPTASSHLAKLEDARMVVVDRVGRERRVRLAGPDVAHVLEQLAALAAPARTHTPYTRRRADELRFARTCYDHLAGVLGVVVTTALVDRGWLRAGDLAPAPALVDWLAEHGHTIDSSHRPIARVCLDWSERVPHLAGATGAAVASVFVAERWVARVRDGRALRITARGRDALSDELGLTLPR